MTIYCDKRANCTQVKVRSSCIKNVKIKLDYHSYKKLQRFQSWCLDAVRLKHVMPVRRQIFVSLSLNVSIADHTAQMLQW